MDRVIWVAELRPGMESTYAKKHQEIWPSMVEMLTESGVYQYSIHLDGSTVIGCYECENAIETQENQKRSAINAEWTAHMKDCFMGSPRVLDNQVMFLP